MHTRVLLTLAVVLAVATFVLAGPSLPSTPTAPLAEQVFHTQP
ncbi:MAG TPA: hypothetical protein VHD32_02085 [Candidatus Didemnitutus sp.]|nr:hypothetical protein [Candidatus Didemnitutus sp.]